MGTDLAVQELHLLSPRSYLLIALAMAALTAVPLSAQQPLNGVYTCANGNPGNAFDYGSIGDFFDDLEDDGVNGPVTLNVFDDGGPFVSNNSYALGTDLPSQSLDPVAGLSLVNWLTIRAAPGESPMIVCGQFVFSGPTPTSALVGFMILYTGYFTVEGLTIRSGSVGVIAGGDELRSSHFRITRCRIFGMTELGIFVDGEVPGGPSFVTIENNLIWDCYYGGMELWRVGIEWLIRHNTVIGPHVAPPVGGIWTGILKRKGQPFETVVGNAFYVSSAATLAPVSCMGGGSGSDDSGPWAVLSDYNIFGTFGTANVGFRFDAAPPTYGLTLAQWQALGYDAHSIVADPKLVNMAAGLEDLHLRFDSPCINFVPLPTTNIDIDGDTRPVGGGRDAGADEFLPPGMAVEFAAAPVPHAGSFSVGGIPLGGAARVFTIRNLGPGVLDLTGNPLVEIIPGANCHAATGVQAMPALTRLAPAVSTDFTLFIRPVGIAPFDLTVSIPSNDPARSPYLFTLTGGGLPPNQPARATRPAGSTFAGQQNGPFQCPMQPGAAMANAVIDLTDPELDAITVLSITPPAVAPAGIIAPAIGTPAHPRVLSWTGIVDASNPPGNYTWTIQFQDAVNQSVITISATIQVANLPPVHLIAGAQGGDGSQGNPYQCGFNRGDDSAAGVNLCTVTDPNSGQTPILGAAIKAGTNPGTVNFAFTLNAGGLSVSPAAMLTVAEAGQHNYQVQVTDGVNTAGIYVVIAVTNTPMNFTTPSTLPEGETGIAYTHGLAVTGAVGGTTYTLTAGQLPDGLALDSAGQIVGTPTQAQAANFTLEAEDTTGATASRTFQLTITDPPKPPGPKPRAEGSNGCAAGAGVWLPLIALLGLLARRRRRVV